jgi:hypothetical protein
VIGLVALAVSSLSRSARLAGLGFVGLIVGLEIVQGVLRHIVRLPQTALVSVQDDLRAVGAALFGLHTGEPGAGWPAAAAALVAVALACLAVLRSRVRAVEIVR